MAKGKNKNKQSGPTPGKTRRKVKPWEWGVIGAAVVLAAWLGWSSRQDSAAGAAFLDLARSGEAALSRVETGRDAGGGHLGPGQSTAYPDRLPTSGVHDTKWVDPGVYESIQPAVKLVHSVEHGMVVVYYDKPPPEAMAALEDWAGLYRDPWSGIVLTPAPGIGEEVVLTAWNQTLRLKSFEPAAAAAFIDRYRGRGPERRVR